MAHAAPEVCRFTDAVAGQGLRAVARTPAERVLLTRLELTAFQRSVGELQVLRRPSSDGLGFVFANALAGIRYGLAEGAAVGVDGLDLTGWAHAVARAQGCNILRLSSAATGELPGDAKSSVVGHQVFADRTVTRIRTRMREALPLGASFEETLAGLGRHTRRNIRHARKHAAGYALTFHAGPSPLPAPVLRRLARRTEPHPPRLARVRTFEAFADQTRQPFRSVLRAPGGALVGYCCGFLGPGTAHLLHQFNDRAYQDIGPSLLHRAFLIEALVERGVRELAFVHGCSGILRHSCLPMVADHWWVMRRTAATRLGAALLARLEPEVLLGRLAKAALSAC